MITPSLKAFLALSRKSTVIPVYKEISADLDTPVSCFLKLAPQRYMFLLESVEGQEKIARYSFLGSGSSLVLKSKGRTIEIIEGNRSRRFVTATDPLDEIKKRMADFRPAQIKGLPRFFGGFVGYVGYDFVRFVEKIPDKNPDDLRLPDMVFMLTDTILVFDHVNHTLKVINNVLLPAASSKLTRKQKERLYTRAVNTIDGVLKQLQRPLASRPADPSVQAGGIEITSNVEKSEFCGIVNKAKNFIRKGDIIQVVPSQRFKARIKKGAFDVYRSLRSLNPSPYMFFLKLDALTLVGASPELLVRCEDGQVRTRPIAGTRRRGKTEEEDLKLEQELRADEKEKAEHLMLVDLGRNDIGRVSKTGSVKVQNFMSVERYSHVMHLVSDVVGVLDRRFDSFDVLRACFPAGTVSGSPKVRAMEIIDELENVRRGPYAGCVGYISFARAMDTCITIRTIVIKDNTAYIQAGAGIVADSVPAKEYAETVNKAKALMEALTR
jgi:anthranilate synthase component 1